MGTATCLQRRAKSYDILKCMEEIKVSRRDFLKGAALAIPASALFSIGTQALTDERLPFLKIKEQEAAHLKPYFDELKQLHERLDANSIIMLTNSQETRTLYEECMQDLGKIDGMLAELNMHRQLGLDALAIWAGEKDAEGINRDKEMVEGLNLLEEVNGLEQEFTNALATFKEKYKFLQNKN